jgi:beta-mannosidase
MTDGARSSRVALVSGWEIAREGEGEGEGEAGWRAVDAPLPVAALLAQAGEWSIDGAPRRFDAETWTYRLLMDAPAAGGRIVFDGLATCCEISFNGQHMLGTRNMFRRHVVELPASAWRPIGNELTLRFESLDAHLAARRPRPRWRAPMVAHQQLRFFRTTLLGRTPGWSPAAAVVGPWQGIWLETPGAAAPEVIEQRAWLDGDAGRVSLAVRIDGGPALVSAVLRSTEPGERDIAWPLERGADGLHRGTGQVPGVRCWWPHTHGTPARYALALRVLPLQRAVDVAQAFETPLGHVGFRALAVERGADGEGFALRVNGQPVFCRGVCWVPLDSLRLHATPERYRSMIATLKAAGANMIRVGGTMVYEDAAFFEACDEAGVMVWQEFMFANMDYPSDDAAFVEEVAAEAAQQLALWQRHASVAVVCGNSEVSQQAAMWGADREAWAPALFHEALAAHVAGALPDVPYWPSSASGGAFPFQPSAGTTSYYGVGAYQQSLDDARHCGLRFATECLAFAQVPDDAALARLAALQDGLAPRTHQPAWKERVPRDLGAGWDFDDVRDHYLERLTGQPAAETRRGDAQAYWTLSRAAAAEAMSTAYAQWRDPASACQGALTWFLRDLRTGAGWGVFDELDRPKAAFHALARAWQPVHAGLVDEGQNGVFAYLVNEGDQPLSGTLVLQFLQGGAVPLGRVERPVELAAHGHWRESTLAHVASFLDFNGSYRFGPAAADVIVATLRDADGATRAECVHFVGALTRADLGLEARARALADGRVRVTLRSRAAARAVHFDAPGWRASDEYFALPPATSIDVDLTAVATPAPAWYGRVGAINGSGWTSLVLEPEA